MNLVQGDCLEKLKELEAGSVRLGLLDPPYGTTFLAWDKVVDFSKLWPELWRVLAPDGAILCFSSQPFTTQVIASQAKHYKHCWYWAKEQGTGFLNVSTQPLRVIEEICVFYKRLSVYNPQMEELAEPKWYPDAGTDSAMTKTPLVGERSKPRTRKLVTHRHPTNLLEFPRELKSKTFMQTQKPVALLEYLIRTYTNSGDLVLDPTMGSGSTGVAAVNQNRDFYGIEFDQERFEIARNRIEQARNSS